MPTISGDNLFMNALDGDDSAVEEHWCDECRRTVAEYLAKQSVVHGEVGSWPAWHVAPYVSIWGYRKPASSWPCWFVGDLRSSNGLPFGSNDKASPESVASFC